MSEIVAVIARDLKKARSYCGGSGLPVEIAHSADTASLRGLPEGSRVVFVGDAAFHMRAAEWSYAVNYFDVVRVDG